MKHPVDIHVGKRIRHQRWVAEMTQQELGEIVGVKFQQIQKYETGANRVSASRLWDIASALRVSIDFFFEGYEDKAVGTADDPKKGDLLTDKEAIELVRAYYAIPEQQRRRLFDLAKILGEGTD